MNSVLANCRFLSVDSDILGKDWVDKSQIIDAQLEELGMDLAEESVYLIFDGAPGSVQSGEAGCRVARSVIGPKKEPHGDLSISDWTHAPVHRLKLKGLGWADIFQECYMEWEGLQRQNQLIAPTFMIVIKRRLSPELDLSLEVLFHA